MAAGFYYTRQLIVLNVPGFATKIPTSFDPEKCGIGLKIFGYVRSVILSMVELFLLA